MSEDHLRRRQALQRLAAAAALESHADYSPIEAWRLSGELPESVRCALRIAADHSLRAEAGALVARILRDYERRRGGVRPYPLFCEPPQTE